MEMSNNICGEKTPDGRTCQRPAGWGTGKKEGPCKDHADTKMKGIKKKKDQFLEIYKNEVISFQAVAKKVRVDQSTIWRWRQKDEEFSQKIEEAKQDQDRKRVEQIEDSMFKRIMEGNATASEVIFYLKNRAPERWRDHPDVQVNVAQKSEVYDLNYTVEKIQENLKKNKVES